MGLAKKRKVRKRRDIHRIDARCLRVAFKVSAGSVPRHMDYVRDRGMARRTATHMQGGS